MKRNLIAGLLALLPVAAGAFDFGAGWNLAGNGKDKVLDVAETFGDPNIRANVSTVWKWDPANQKWAFYSPAQTDGGVSYAASKGYQALKTILPGEGFWVNATASFSTYDPAEPAVELKPWQLLPGWNLVATGAGVSPAQFSASIAPFTATTLWAWDRSGGAWYFYTPSLSTSALAAYLASKQYRDFGSLTLAHGTGFWVNRAGSGASPTATLPALDQAKQLIAEVRTTGSSWANATDTGALNAQLNAMSNLASGIAVPGGSALTYRLSALDAGETLFREIKAGQTAGYTASFDAAAVTAVYSTIRNDYQYDPNYPTPVPGYAYFKCQTNPIGTAQPLASVSCVVGDDKAVSFQYNWSDGSSSAYFDPTKTMESRTETITYTHVVFTEATAGYTYDADLRQAVTTYSASTASPPTTVVNTLPGSYAGSLQKTFDFNGVSQTLTLSGELPSTVAGSAKMTVNASATRGVVSGGTCTTVSTTSYCPTRYDLSGTIAGVDAQGATVYSLALDSGSRITMMESALGEPIPTGATPTDMNLLVTVQAAGSKFSGTAVAQNFAFDADNNNWNPTSTTLTGTFSDVSAGGAGVIFNGSATLGISNWASYHSLQPQSSLNYPHEVVTINGALQLPSRPLMGLTLVATKTGVNTSTLAGEYVYGNGISLTIAGSTDSSTAPPSNSLTLTNQDGVVLTFPSASDATLSKAGTTLGSVSNGTVYYSDGTFESLQ